MQNDTIQTHDATDHCDRHVFIGAALIAALFVALKLAGVIA